MFVGWLVGWLGNKIVFMFCSEEPQASFSVCIVCRLAAVGVGGRCNQGDVCRTPVYGFADGPTGLVLASVMAREHSMERAQRQ